LPWHKDQGVQAEPAARRDHGEYEKREHFDQILIHEDVPTIEVWVVGH
jgi:hypothetical protein